ncbi:Intraflagellar transport protein 52 homolog like protein [Aduncisulcus paluster]|uniref:Intraflagellar transport protein 52 homolog like protein n=1 Tax=Aduncisulcus paluster TaxID=2918883 RepID=A0ABQ5KBH7_9EUKA|nr:Intraflagellar transport protein 52 homolog like protein [Aduncisulcus paluster]
MSKILIDCDLPRANLKKFLKSLSDVDFLSSPLKPSTLGEYKLFISIGKKEAYSDAECDLISQFLFNDGSLLIAYGEMDGDSSAFTSILSQSGIRIKSDSVINTAYMGQTHPKHCVIKGGIANRGLTNSLHMSKKDGHSFIFPMSRTLECNAPAITLLTTGDVCFPARRPLVAVSTLPSSSGTVGEGSKVCVLGSSLFMTDKFVTRQNLSLISVLVDWLSNDEPEMVINAVDADDPPTSEYKLSQNIGSLSTMPHLCLHRGPSLPSDFRKLICSTIYAPSMSSCVSSCVEAYEKLAIPHEMLDLVRPDITLPIPPLEAAVHPPQLPSPPCSPKIELYDLDEAFSDTTALLARSAGRALGVGAGSEEGSDGSALNIDAFVQSAGDCLGVIQRLEKREGKVGKCTSKDILHHMLSAVMKFKQFEGELSESREEERDVLMINAQ